MENSETLVKEVQILIRNAFLIHLSKHSIYYTKTSKDSQLKMQNH